VLVEFTPEQEMFRHAVRDFCVRDHQRVRTRCDRESRPPRDLYEKLGEMGWLGINIPVEYGGSGGGAMEVAILLEELGRVFLDLRFGHFEP
jgi:alkylation response protein AidB-like acyl-CoA dehydrogenase